MDLAVDGAARGNAAWEPFVNAGVEVSDPRRAFVTDGVEVQESVVRPPASVEAVAPVIEVPGPNRDVVEERLRFAYVFGRTLAATQSKRAPEEVSSRGPTQPFGL
jgi:hypothetical protein